MRMMNSGTGQSMIQSMMMSNPVFQNASQMMNQVRDPKAAFYSAAKQKGVDPEAAVAQLQQLLKG